MIGVALVDVLCTADAIPSTVCGIDFLVTSAHRTATSHDAPVPVSWKAPLLWVYSQHYNTIDLGNTVDTNRAKGVKTWRFCWL
jgi:hypothetical protein